MPKDADSNISEQNTSQNESQSISPKHQNDALTRHSFIVMEKLGKTLQQYFQEKGKGFSLKTVCNICIRILHQLEALHDLGKIYNDLKMENILVGDRKI